MLDHAVRVCQSPVVLWAGGGGKVDWVVLMGVPASGVGVATPVGTRMVELEGMVAVHVTVMVVGTGRDTVTVWMLMTNWVLVTVIFCNGLVMVLEGGLVGIGERVVSVPAWDGPLGAAWASLLYSVFAEVWVYVDSAVYVVLSEDSFRSPVHTC